MILKCSYYYEYVLIQSEKHLKRMSKTKKIIKTWFLSILQLTKIFLFGVRLFRATCGYKYAEIRRKHLNWEMWNLDLLMTGNQPFFTKSILT